MNFVRLFAVVFVLGLLSVASPAADSEAMLRTESLGGLKLGLPAPSVLKLLGKPEKQGAIVYQGADGLYVQPWHYPAQGIDLLMSAEKKSGAQTIANMTVKAPCPLATKQNIKIGSAESAARKAYAAYADHDSPAEPGVFVAGSIYGGIIFHFERGKVSRIFFGAAAE